MNLSENIQRKKLLVIQDKHTEICLNVTEKSEIVKNPIPILWNLEGLYGWIPIEIVKNEISYCLMKEIDCKIDTRILHFTWRQTYRLRQDVGRVLEAQDNVVAGLSELLNEQMLEELGK